jgi:hypothetical protein
MESRIARVARLGKGPGIGPGDQGSPTSLGQGGYP